MDIIIVGGFSEVFEAIEENGYNIIGYIDFKENKKYSNYKWLGNDKKAEEILINYPNTEIIITPDEPKLRKKLCYLYKSYGFIINTFISKHSMISPSSVIKEGSFVQKLVHISANISIGKMVKINVGANIMHDSSIGDYSTIAPNVVLLGNVKIGSNCYIGANATILPNIVIEDNVVVGAGSVVTKNVATNQIIKGNPAR